MSERGAQRSSGTRSKSAAGPRAGSRSQAQPGILKGLRDVPPVLVLVGMHPTVLDRTLDEVRSMVFVDAPPSDATPPDAGGDKARDASGFALVGADLFQEERFDARTIQASELLASVQSLSLFGDQRLLWARGAEAWKAGDWEAIVAYMEQPADDVHLVISATQIDGRTAFAKRAKKAGAWFEAPVPKGRGVAAYVREEAAARGLTMSEMAVERVVALVGADVVEIQDALDRLRLYAGEGDAATGAVGTEAVDALLSQSAGESIWALVDAVSERRQRDAMLACRFLLSQREAPLRIMGMLLRQLRMMVQVHASLAVGQSWDDALRAAGVPPFKARGFRQAVGRYSARELAESLFVLSQADIAMKGSPVPADLVLQDVVAKIAAPAKAAESAALRGGFGHGSSGHLRERM